MEWKPKIPWMRRAMEKADHGDMEGCLKDAYAYIEIAVHNLLDLYMQVPRDDWPLLHTAVRAVENTMTGIMDESELELTQSLLERLEVIAIDENELRRQSGQDG